MRPGCGTNTGYHAHWRAGEKACAPCRAAHADRQQLYVTGSTRRRQLQPCGTPAAYTRHRLRGEMPCQPCVDANRARNRGSYYAAQARRAAS